MRVDYITRESLRNFYENFSGLAGDNLEKVATEGYRSMSANGDYELDYKSYKLLFSNFLLGRTIYGPGRIILSLVHKNFGLNHFLQASTSLAASTTGT